MRFPYAFWGSKNLFNEAKKEDVIDITRFNGIKFVDAMHNVGFDFKDESEPIRDDIKAFVEIKNYEQGNVLKLGAISWSCGGTCWTNVIQLSKSTANHAENSKVKIQLRLGFFYALVKYAQSIDKA
ncbi:hypothetical protein [Carnobacterium maltaromaticum]|uniref:hypothetical protein n=1 Tax=Carnobacterium maltaromaticum TaxID=2751 RepID=UPI0039BE138C